MADYNRGFAAAAERYSFTAAVRHLLGKFRLELVFVGLLVATFVAINFEEQLLRRTIIINPQTKLSYSHAHSDATTGGTSTVAADQTRPMSWHCDLQNTYAYPYCAYEWVLSSAGEGSGFDLTRFDRLTVDLTYQGSANSLRLHLKNYDPRYSKPGRVNPYKFNTSEVAFTRGRQAVPFQMNDFSVAEWWILQHSLPPGLSHPQFDNIVALEVSTGTGAPLGAHKFQVHEIRFEGRYLTKQEWYLVIAAAWMALMSFFLFRLRWEVKARQEAEGRAERHARHDPITGFLNRRTFADQFERELASLVERGEAGALFLLEIEHLTSASDIQRNAAGDALLIEVASRIRNTLGPETLIGRVRDDEFACLVPGDLELLRGKSAELLQQLNCPILQGGGSISVVATIGVACFPQHGASCTHLLRLAEIALRDGQRAGRLICRFFDPEMSILDQDAASSGAAYKQPKFVRAAAMEMLVRESCRIAATSVAGSAVAVQLSADQLEDEWTADRLITVMTCSQFEPSDLVIKVSEGCLLRASSTAARNLQTLRQAGIRIALTDFRNISAGRSKNIVFDQVELNDDYLNSQIAAGKGLLKGGAALPVKSGDCTGLSGKAA